MAVPGDAEKKLPEKARTDERDADQFEFTETAATPQHARQRDADDGQGGGRRQRRQLRDVHTRFTHG